ncbi:MAG: outer membrane protein assembly factor BamA [Desulfuromonadales bacterium]|nr:outer membrane protein assembly factor BamA [Desulfuromonadales bacterium]
MVKIKKFFCIVLLFLLFVTTSAFADDEVVNKIKIDGNKRIETAVIENVLKMKSGEPLSYETIDKDIRAIYNLGYFSDVKVDKSRDGNGIQLTYIVTEKPILMDIKINGNKAIKSEKIEKALTLQVGKVFSPKDIPDNIQKIKQLYIDEGYYLVEVEYKKEQSASGNIALTFTIQEGVKTPVREIHFHGNKIFDDSQLKKAMQTRTKWFLSWLTGSGIYKDETVKNDVAALIDMYMNKGYINVKVDGPHVTLTPDKKGLVLDFFITEGDQFRYGTIDFKGDLLETKGELANRLQIKQGEVFSRAALRQEIMSFTDFYADKGYAFVNVTPLTRIDPDQKTIDITFEFEKGNQVHIGKINIDGNTKTRDKVIRREMQLIEGDMYGATALKKSKQNLMNLGYFEQADITTAKTDDPDKLNVDVAVKEKSTGSFSVGGGYSSVDGLIGQASVQQSNFLGLGLTGTFSVAIGANSSMYNIGLTDPHFLDTDWTLGADVYRTERDYIDYTRRATGFDIKGGRSLTDTISTMLMYKYEQVRLRDESIALQETRLKYPDTVSPPYSTTSSVTWSLSRNATDFYPDPSKGMKNSLSVEYAGLGGTNKFIRAIGETTQFFPMGLGTVLSFHGTVGYMNGFGNLLPLDSKFYLGGINSIRGYYDYSISPYRRTYNYDQATGAPISSDRAYLGGDSQVVFNVEYVAPIMKSMKLKGVVFFDAGNSTNGFDTLFNKLQMSYGAGIRWFSPIGPLRLEYGIPVNPRTGIDKKSGRLEFSVGGFF